MISQNCLHSEKSPSISPATRAAVWIAALVLVSVLTLGACEDSDAPPAASSDVPQTVPTAESGANAVKQDEAAPAAPAPQDPMLLPTAIPAPDNLQIPQGVPEEIATVWEVWSLLTEQHVDRRDFDPSVFDESAVRGLIEGLGDPHSGYVPPEAFEIENQDLYGSFEGIGARVEMRPDGKLLIVSPIEGGPAEAAGLKPGDLVLEVNGESIVGLSLLEAVNKIRGPKGSEVRLLVKHLTEASEVEIVVVRDTIPLDSVFVRSRPDDRFAHIRLTTFYANTAEKLAEAIRESQAIGAEGLILDVRDNPGGLLSSVIDVTSMFLEDDDLILYELDGMGERDNHMARNAGEFADIPLVVLANGFSASASEIVVGAIQDHGRAPVVGSTTFGKGSVNILRRLSNGGGLYMTIAKWYTPSGRLIEGNGVEPDHEVTSRDKQKADTSQFEKAIEVMEELVNGAQSGGA